MQIKDTTGRTMLVDFVYRDAKLGWLKAPSFNLMGRSRQHVRLPYGQYAIRVCSKSGADVILFENGQQRIATSVPGQKQIIELDQDGTSLCFKAPDADAPVIGNDSATVHAQLASVDTTDAAAVAPVADDAQFIPPTPVAGHGVVFLVVRFAKENNPYGEPPQEEFELTYQMHQPDEFAATLAANFLHVEAAPDLPNPADPMSSTPSSACGTKGHRRCAFCAHKH